ncbi:hypothetical protein MHYP_G00129430 [Metynnis hypsauchen]
MLPAPAPAQMSLQPKGIGAPALGQQAWGELLLLYDQKPLSSVTVGDGEVKDDLLKVCCSHSNCDRSERPLNHIEVNSSYKQRQTPVINQNSQSQQDRQRSASVLSAQRVVLLEGSFAE